MQNQGRLLYYCGVNILALDSSTEACSAALLREDGAVFAEFEIAPRQHNRLLPLMMDRVLANAELAKTMLTYCAYANGPGAFTGIRPLLPISTLAIRAQKCLSEFDRDRTLGALDARMEEIYWAVYTRDQTGLARLQDSERLDPIASVSIPPNIDCGAGHGWLPSLREGVDFPIAAELLPDANSMLMLARDMAESGQTVSAEQASINYLRMQVAVKAGS